MLKSRLAILTLSAVVTVGLFAVPTESSACAFLDRLCGRAPAAVPTYAPACPTACDPCAAPACNPCTTYSPCATCVPQTVRYLPQTRYRFMLTTVPTTTYRPAVAVDPCSGCATTTYRPVVRYRRQFGLVPYTTYRVSYATPYVASYGSPCVSSCAPCGTACSPCGTACDPCGSACDPCGSGGCPGGVCPTTTSSATTFGSSCPGGSCAPVITQSVPYNNGTTTSDATSAPQQTFEQNNQPSTQEQLKPTPQIEQNSLPGEPRLITPSNERSASRGVQHAGYFHLIASPPQVAPVQPVAMPVEDDGWRASTD